MNTHVPSFATMEFLREHGLLVCHCYRPRLEWLGLWDCYQCRACGRLVQR